MTTLILRVIRGGVVLDPPFFPFSALTTAIILEFFVGDGGGLPFFSVFRRGEGLPLGVRTNGITILPSLCLGDRGGVDRGDRGEAAPRGEIPADGFVLEERVGDGVRSILSSNSDSAEGAIFTFVARRSASDDSGVEPNDEDDAVFFNFIGFRLDLASLILVKLLERLFSIFVFSGVEDLEFLDDFDRSDEDRCNPRNLVPNHCPLSKSLVLALLLL
eukprot:CAMPEP_0194403804 /NCGR_PEP_ID=MMETSP0176-20130528/2422_1 /TAXON_ID=216777 /ORGANISM="Proboscia alata, Strain PI-D3" /LENGTH=216 /DNA_ID=CAMNT_0039201837 /DNA_START=614 /DNA_END=1265 /DNA_ORIENTATION=-